uniref:Uncharacterized protein n=1 Tax=Anopheles culicifacies TaxID=139723 RepID=A0A182MX26_9DIPT
MMDVLWLHLRVKRSCLMILLLFSTLLYSLISDLIRSSKFASGAVPNAWGSNLGTTSEPLLKPPEQGLRHNGHDGLVKLAIQLCVVLEPFVTDRTLVRTDRASQTVTTSSVARAETCFLSMDALRTLGSWVSLSKTNGAGRTHTNVYDYILSTPHCRSDGNRPMLPDATLENSSRGR